MIPDHDYAPIQQTAVLLKKGAENPAATALLDYSSNPPAALAIIEEIRLRFAQIISDSLIMLTPSRSRHFTFNLQSSQYLHGS
jgi:hypothetical protein